MQPGNLELGSGLVRFRSKEQARAYLEALLQHYKAKSEEYGGQMGELLRGAQQPVQELKEAKPTKEAQKVGVKGWVRMGTMPVNASEPLKALGEVTLKIVEDCKMKVEKTAEALKSFDEVDTRMPGSPSLILFINRGVPEALIVDEGSKRSEIFAFNARFRAV